MVQELEHKMEQLQVPAAEPSSGVPQAGGPDSQLPVPSRRAEVKQEASQEELEDYPMEVPQVP